MSKMGMSNVTFWIMRKSARILTTCAVKLTLEVHYPTEYPEVLPELSISPLEGLLEEAEQAKLLQELSTVVRHVMMNLKPRSVWCVPQGEENLGMAMTFTLVSHLRDRLSLLIREREEARRRHEMEQERLVLEASILLSSGSYLGNWRTIRRKNGAREELPLQLHRSKPGKSSLIKSNPHEKRKRRKRSLRLWRPRNGRSGKRRQYG
jgi:hypothetical protein